jgi:hypothetical protein
MARQWVRSISLSTMDSGDKRGGWGVWCRFIVMVVDCTPVERDRESVGGKDIGRAVVKPIVAVQRERHDKETIVAVKMD